MKRLFYYTFILLLLTVAAGLWMLMSHGFPPSEEALADKPHRLTVLTWNTARMGGFMKPEANEALRFLKRQNADVLCLQEVDVYKYSKYLTLSEVKSALRTKYPYSYIDFSVYNSRHQFGTMVWSKFPLIHKQSIHYKTIGNLSNRCDIVVGKDTIRLINNHLESYNFTSEDLGNIEKIEEKWQRALPLRHEQARTIRKEIESSPYPVIVAGDFNSTPLSYVYWHLSRGMHDAWQETSFGHWGATCEKRGIGMRIDYLLSSRSLQPVESHLNPFNGSDHRPLTATFAW